MALPFPILPIWNPERENQPVADSSKFGDGAERTENRGIKGSRGSTQVSFSFGGRDTYLIVRDFLDNNVIFTLDFGEDTPSTAEYFIEGTAQITFTGPEIYQLSFTAAGL